MRAEFPGYFSPSDGIVKKLWREAVVAFDASALLHCYRYSDQTRDEIFKLMDKVRSRIWVPHRAGQEFSENRTIVILAQQKAYDDLKKDLNKVDEPIRGPRHPHLSAELSKQWTALADKIRKECDEKKNTLVALIKKDVILDRIEELLSDQIGRPYNESKLWEILAEGERRYKAKIPPGFCDTSGKEGVRLYGDLLIWFQLMDKAKESKTGVIFITGDMKEDWWRRVDDKPTPRPELIAEMKEKTGTDFFMYSVDQFLAQARKFLHEEVNEMAISEAKQVRVQMDEVRRFLASGAAAQVMQSYWEQMAHLQDAIQAAAQTFQVRVPRFGPLMVPTTLPQATPIQVEPPRKNSADLPKTSGPTPDGEKQ